MANQQNKYKFLEYIAEIVHIELVEHYPNYHIVLMPYRIKVSKPDNPKVSIVIILFLVRGVMAYSYTAHTWPADHEDCELSYEDPLFFEKLTSYTNERIKNHTD